MRLTKQTSVVIGLGSAQTLAYGSTYYLPAILAAPMARDLGVSTGLVFGAFSAALVIAAMLGPMAGRRIDLFGGRDVLAVSNLVLAAGLAILGLAQGAAMLFAGWSIIGVGMAMGLYEAASRCSRAWRALSAGRSPPGWKPSSTGASHASSGQPRTSRSGCRSTAFSCHSARSTCRHRPNRGGTRLPAGPPGFGTTPWCCSRWSSR
jgi:MFS family permease